MGEAELADGVGETEEAVGAGSEEGVALALADMEGDDLVDGEGEVVGLLVVDDKIVAARLGIVRLSVMTGEVTGEEESAGALVTGGIGDSA